MQLSRFLLYEEKSISMLKVINVRSFLDEERKPTKPLPKSSKFRVLVQSKEGELINKRKVDPL